MKKMKYIHRNSVGNTNHVMETLLPPPQVRTTSRSSIDKKKGAELALGPLLIPQNPTHKSFYSHAGQMLDPTSPFPKLTLPLKSNFSALAPLLLAETVYDHELGWGT
jgi:hypothetical protein